MNKLSSLVESDSKAVGIIWGIIIGIVVIVISVAATFYLIYNFQPAFLCDLCRNTTIPDFSLIP